MVLAERDKDDMDKQLKKALWGHKIEWHTRSGAPHSIADLEKVAAGQARTIIILQPDQEQVGPSHIARTIDPCRMSRASLVYSVCQCWQLMPEPFFPSVTLHTLAGRCLKAAEETIV